MERRMEHVAVTPFLFDLIILNRLPERSFQKWEVGPFQNGKKQEGGKNEEFRDESVARRWWRRMRRTLGVLQCGWSEGRHRFKSHATKRKVSTIEAVSGKFDKVCGHLTPRRAKLLFRAPMESRMESSMCIKSDGRPFGGKATQYNFIWDPQAMVAIGRSARAVLVSPFSDDTWGLEPEYAALHAWKIWLELH